MLYKAESEKLPLEIEIHEGGQVYLRKNFKKQEKEEGNIYVFDEAHGVLPASITENDIAENFDKYFNICSCWVVDFENEKNAYIQAVQQMMDARAQAKGYDNIATACTYVNSTDETFKAEAERYVAWRDNVWRTCYSILDEIVQGKREKLPTVEEVLAELPMLLEV